MKVIPTCIIDDVKWRLERNDESGVFAFGPAALYFIALFVRDRGWVRKGPFDGTAVATGPANCSTSPRL